MSPMYLYAAMKWGVAWMVIAGVDRWSDGLSLGAAHRGIFISFILAVIGLWLDRQMTADRSSTTAAVVDLLSYSSLIYGLQYLFPSVYVDTNTALTVGLLLAGAELLFHPLFPVAAGKRRHI
ncbi:hypothetical protein ACFQ49_16800 [Kroppenstedtia eburnea]|uniref:Uncharacterized protein n=1 Tax=Kroppenstedtia eburnea TaxID=714067 RepID=A0A1N7JNB9_9BACL|nr:hypothetical protein [Kroppenstedtia eburnea]QKI83499.1 hypothetical protein GXN75_16785 [Kroppenstedtia eburnea]SIS50849.1 hypothetical protein SAMN05421790_102228 [Kroppenstedtia eburnea]